MGTFAAAGIAALSYRRSRESEHEDQASQARLVMRTKQMPMSKRDPDGRIRWWIVFTNHSNKPIYNLQIHSMRAQVDDDGPGVPVACVSKTMIGQTVLWAGGFASAQELAPGEDLETYWAADESAHCPDGVRTYQLSLLDSNGRMWEVVDGCEPRKIQRPMPPDDLMKATQ